MGYTTEFYGRITTTHPINEELATFINNLSESRRMKRDVKKTKEIYPDWKDHCFMGNIGKEGEFFAYPGKNFGQDHTEDIIDYNHPPKNQPGLWLDWIVSDDRMGIEWSGGEKFYNYVEWLEYILSNFFHPIYLFNGEIEYQGEEDDDHGLIIVKNNIVYIEYLPPRESDDSDAYSEEDDDESDEDCGLIPTIIYEFENNRISVFLDISSNIYNN